MIVDRLIVHHTYNGSTAFDLSRNSNHGKAEGSIGFGGGTVNFEDGADCIRVPVSESLASLRAVRVSVRFRWTPAPLLFPHRFNLIEGYLSFALMIERVGEKPVGQLVGSILDRAGNWQSIRSAAPGVVSPRKWHTAVFVHDGVSSCRLDLDGVTVAESFSVLGPVSGVKGPFGLAIGHWPDPDPRYTFAGDIAEVKVWKDRPEAIRDAADLCCCTEAPTADEAFARWRVSGADATAHVSAAEDLYDVGLRTFGLMAAGGGAQRDRAHDLARRIGLALRSQNLQALQDTIAAAATISIPAMSSAERTQLTNRMVAALRQTVIGPFLDAVLQGRISSGEDLEQALADYDLDSWLTGFCFDWATDHRQDEGKRPTAHPGHGSDPTVGSPVGEEPPYWDAAGGSNSPRGSSSAGPEEEQRKDTP